MAGVIEKIELKAKEHQTISQVTETFVAPGSTAAMKFQGSPDGVYLQVSGPATAVEIVVERSTNDPTGTANWAPAMSSPLTGNPSTGIAPLIFDEPSRGYWRARVVSMTGASVTVVLSGEQA